MAKMICACYPEGDRENESILNMDYVALIYYGLVCGVLGVAAPMLRKRWARFVFGIAVGVVAVTLLPEVRAFLA